MIINKPIFVAVGKLYLRAFDARAAALTKKNRNLSTPPEYIIKLRGLREEAKERRKVMISRSKVRETGGKGLTTIDPNSTRPDIIPKQTEPPVENQLQQYQ